MRRHSRWLLSLFIAQAVVLASCSKQQPITGPEHAQRGAGQVAPLLAKPAGPSTVPNAYIVVFKDDVASVDGEVEQIGQQLGIQADYRYKYAIKGFAAKMSASAVAALRNDPNVAYIEQDQIAHIVATQANPTWGLDRIDQRARPLDASYTYNVTGAGVDAYILDTGIRLTHNEFGGRAVTGYDAITAGGTATDGNGHGTHTSGTVGGATYGVAKGVRLIAVRVLDNSGSGSYAQVIAGVDWVTSNHTTTPAVANMSLGGPISTALDDAVRRSIADGVTYCVSAGNGSANASTQSPADVAEAITVGATDINDGWASFSNFGAGVDISGPGVDITSSWYTTNTATNTISGTSMSSPHVAGVAALYLAANPTATPAAVSTALTTNATANVITGIPSGTPNRLVYSLFGAPPPPPPPPAAPTLASPADAATGVAVPAALSWNASSGATSYRVQVSTSSSFATFAYDQSVTGTSTSVSGLAASTVYYWRVNATNAGGTSAFSATRSFTTASTPPPPPGPPVPVLSAPANAATNVAVPATLSWAASSGATSYRVQVSTSSTFTTLFLDRTGVTTTSTSVAGLASTTVYYWRVLATNAGGSSAFSAARSFTTRCTGNNCNN
jgi:subtilisin family serine protease